LTPARGAAVQPRPRPAPHTLPDRPTGVPALVGESAEHLSPSVGRRAGSGAGVEALGRSPAAVTADRRAARRGWWTRLPRAARRADAGAGM